MTFPPTSRRFLQYPVSGIIVLGCFKPELPLLINDIVHARDRRDQEANSKLHDSVITIIASDSKWL